VAARRCGASQCGPELWSPGLLVWVGAHLATIGARRVARRELSIARGLRVIRGGRVGRLAGPHSAALGSAPPSTCSRAASALELTRHGGGCARVKGIVHEQ
jgi:hypothetical protein